MLSLVISLPNIALAHGYAVQVNGNDVAGAMAEMRDGQLMVALRPFAEALGGSVQWHGSAKRATLSVNGSQLALWLDTTLAYQDGVKVWAPVKPYLKNDRMMAPAWWLAVRLGASVQFSGSVLKIGDMAGRIGQPPGHLLMNGSYYFPYPQGAVYEPYYDTMGAARYDNGRIFGHEGTDIMAPKGTPIVAVAAGSIVRYGWNRLGGYRFLIQLDEQPGYRFYYAHMDYYAPDISLGTRVKAGQLLGYVGNTGEGPERTEGKFAPHIHFGIYGPDGAVNPYPFLKYWEQNKIAR